MLRVRHFPPKPLEELHRCSLSMCDHFVRDSARVPLLLTITVQHRLLPRANVSRMYAECFDKVLYHVNLRILKCKMTNVITRPQAARVSNSRFLGIHVHHDNTHFSTDQLMECQLQMREVAQKLVNTSLFSFQDLKLSTNDIIAILKDTLNITSSPLPILDPHVTWVPSRTLERQSIGSRVKDGTRNLVISFNMVKLMGSPSFDSIFTYQKGAKNTSFMDLLLNKGVVDNHYLHKVSHSFLKLVLSERTSITIGIAIVNNTKSTIQLRGHKPKVVLFDIGVQPMILGV